MAGVCGGKGAVEFACGIKVFCPEQNLESIGNSLVVTQADEVVIALTSATSFYEEGDLVAIVKDKLDATPSFYVNGKLIDFVAAEAETQDDIYNLIVEAIEKELAEEE